jgi:hypothetical protein
MIILYIYINRIPVSYDTSDRHSTIIHYLALSNHPFLPHFFFLAGFFSCPAFRATTNGCLTLDLLPGGAFDCLIDDDGPPIHSLYGTLIPYLGLSKPATDNSLITDQIRSKIRTKYGIHNQDRIKTAVRLSWDCHCTRYNLYIYWQNICTSTPVSYDTSDSLPGTIIPDPPPSISSSWAGSLDAPLSGPRPAAASRLGPLAQKVFWLPDRFLLRYPTIVWVHGGYNPLLWL